MLEFPSASDLTSPKVFDVVGGEGHSMFSFSSLVDLGFSIPMGQQARFGGFIGGEFGYIYTDDFPVGLLNTRQRIC